MSIFGVRCWRMSHGDDVVSVNLAGICGALAGRVDARVCGSRGARAYGREAGEGGGGVPVTHHRAVASAFAPAMAVIARGRAHLGWLARWRAARRARSVRGQRVRAAEVCGSGTDSVPGRPRSADRARAACLGGRGLRIAHGQRVRAGKEREHSPDSVSCRKPSSPKPRSSVSCRKRRSEILDPACRAENRARNVHRQRVAGKRELEVCTGSVSREKGSSKREPAACRGKKGARSESRQRVLQKRERETSVGSVSCKKTSPKWRPGAWPATNPARDLALEACLAENRAQPPGEQGDPRVPQPTCPSRLARPGQSG
jgi:hypothetical protein